MCTARYFTIIHLFLNEYVRDACSLVLASNLKWSVIMLMCCICFLIQLRPLLWSKFSDSVHYLILGLGVQTQPDSAICVWFRFSKWKQIAGCNWQDCWPFLAELLLIFKGPMDPGSLFSPLLCVSSVVLNLTRRPNRLNIQFLNVATSFFLRII